MSKVPRSKLRLREKEAWDLNIQGWTHQRIADHLVVERSTVTKILQRLSIRASQQLLPDMVVEKVRQIEILHRIVDECMQAWERSKAQEKSATKHETSRDGTDMKIVQTTQHVEENIGDPRYLAEARCAMADIRKILGLDYPLRLLQLDMGKLTNAQIDAIASGQDPLVVMTQIE